MSQIRSIVICKLADHVPPNPELIDSKQTSTSCHGWIAYQECVLRESVCGYRVLKEANLLREHEDEDVSLHQSIVVVIAVHEVHREERRAPRAHRVVVIHVDCALGVLVVRNLEVEEQIAT